jgi:HK97 gp10 family phage protein
MAQGEIVKINLLGADQLNKTLKLLPGELAKNVYMQSLRKGAVLVRDAAKERAPYGSDFEKRSYTKKKKGVATTHFVKLRDEIRITVTTKTDISFAVAVHVGAAYWGMFSEFGTSHQAAKPWLRPAFDGSAEDALNMIGQSLGKGVERAADKLCGSLAKSGLLKRMRG